MIIVTTIVHVVMCVILIAIVLLQTGKGADIGAAFGGASHTLFGGAGPANFLNRVTTIAAVMFMLTSLTLALLSTQKSSSSIILEKAGETQTEQGPSPDQQSGLPQQDTEQITHTQDPATEAIPLEKESTDPSTSQEGSGSSTGTESKETSSMGSSSETPATSEKPLKNSN